MKANELRIGSILSNAGGKIIKCTVQTISDFESGLIILKPIPLTEEWLVRFGFEKIIYDSDETGYGTEYHLRVNDELFISYEDDFSCELYDSKIRMHNGIGIIPSWEQTKYVHGLQNIVFALTGEELTLSE